MELSSDKEKFPSTIIVSDLDKLVLRSSQDGDKNDRDSRLMFLRLSAILTDFSDFLGQQNKKPSTLLVFSRLDPPQMKLVESRLQEWYSEIWRMEDGRISCESSKHKMIVNFSLENNQYCLDSLQF